MSTMAMTIGWIISTAAHTSAAANIIVVVVMMGCWWQRVVVVLRLLQGKVVTAARNCGLRRLMRRQRKGFVLHWNRMVVLLQ